MDVIMDQLERELAFEEMVNYHDLTYEYSDDGGVWRAGSASLYRIKEAAKTLDPEFVKKTWNAMVDNRVNANAASQFYWKG